MNRWLCSLLALVPIASNAQDWNPILHGRKYNYKADTSQHIQFGVWIDSVKWNGTDSVYCLNRIVTDCDTCLIPGSKLYDQGTFFNRFMQPRADGGFWCYDPGSYVLRPADSVNASWLFDTTQNITATIIASYQDVLWSITDSFKTILLSTGDTIIIGKNLGVIRFPTSDPNISYVLTGIDMGPMDWGETVIDFWDIYGFEIGDVIQYSDGWADASGPYGYEDYERITKYKILEQSTLPTGFLFEVVLYRWERRSWQVGPPPGFWIKRCTDTSSVFFNRHDVENVDVYPSQLSQDSYFYHACWMEPVYFVYSFGRSATGRPFKDFTWDYGSNGVAYWMEESNKNLLPLGSDSCSQFGPISVRSTYGKRMGTIAHWGSYFENGLWLKLQGYLQDGELFGELDPDSFFAGKCNVAVSDLSPALLVVYPIPAQESVFIVGINEPVIITLLDAHGRTIVSQLVDTRAEIHVASIPSGLYILTATSPEGQLLWAEKVVKQ